ncbi:MAG: protein-glutamate O-methyltransferase CheR [Caldilineaceae bacterium]
MSIDLLHYRTLQMERRLATHLQRSGHENWTLYAQSLRQQPEEARRFLKFLTINVSSFYRDSDKWDYLAGTILPKLLSRCQPRGLEAWSVGCSIGAEPYTLAMLLRELAGHRRHRIHAGDIDPVILEMAQAAGPYSNNDIRELPSDLVSHYLLARDDSHYRVCAEIRGMVHFARFDILKDRAVQMYDLVICRNLVIYFTPAMKERVFLNLAQSVRPGGVFFIGSTETIPNYGQCGFRYLAPSFYQRIE